MLEYQDFYGLAVHFYGDVIEYINANLATVCDPELFPGPRPKKIHDKVQFARILCQRVLVYHSLIQP